MRTAVRSAATSSPQQSFRLYVEGPRDRGLVETWAKTRSHDLAHWVARETFILGGSQPRRAVEDFSRRRREGAGIRGLCLLDRDQGELDLEPCRRDGLDFFVWPRRHIESYLLVPGAIRRSLRLRDRDPSVRIFFETEVPAASDEAAFRNFDAKGLFGKHGQLSAHLGRAVLPSRVARAMRAEELHADVAALLDRLSEGVGVGSPPTAVHKPKALST